MSNYLDRFRYKSGIEKENASRISDVIASSLSKYEVVIERLDKAIPIVFINNDKEGVDEAIIYSYNEDALVVGDYFYFSDYWYLIYKEQKNVKRENYIDSFLAVKCNINFDFNGQNIKAHYRGPMRMSRNPLSDLGDNFGVTSEMRSYIMVPTISDLKVNNEFDVNGQGFRIEEIDKSTTPGIYYLNVQKVNLVNTTKQSDAQGLEPLPTPEQVKKLYSGMEQTLTTEDGYIDFSYSVKIIERKNTQIKFILPSNINTITIVVKKDGELFSQVYEVVNNV